MKRRDRVDAAVEAMLRDRRPPGFDADPEESTVLETAALLRAGRAGADLPTPAFVGALERRLRDTLADGDARPRPSRRAVVRGAGLAAAAVVVGAAADRLAKRLTGGGGSEADGGRAGTLAPDDGGWAAVARLDDVIARRAVRFTAGGVAGVLVARGGGVDGLSAVCTHMGCLLEVSADAGRLRCPCHGASFGLDGTPDGTEYLQSLPRLVTRISGGTVEVLLPRPRRGA